MKTLLLFALFSLSFAGVFAQASADAKSISMMGVPLEGPDSVFMPALEAAGFVQVHPEEPEPDTYYFEGDFYGIPVVLTALTTSTIEIRNTLLDDFSGNGVTSRLRATARYTN